MSKLVYLSGPITGLTYENATDWRGYVRQELAFKIGSVIQTLSPMRGKEYLKGAGIIGIKTHEKFSEAINAGQAIVTRDRWDTMRSDFILMNLLGATEVSKGTMVELGWADAARIPVVLCMEKTGNIHEHCFVRELCGYHVTSLDEGIDQLIAALT